ncbi:hypothetical protein ACFQJC_02440 [Haloferax namakaokahaiae]|uniref:DoxX family protein n=1 Tax=Haloferax namakaokahaiae TaxID=1748331 RepID=A0ABD5ZAT4_9EURY
MLRTVLRVVGIVEFFRPGALVRTAERLALENPDECEMRPWMTPVMRSEGAILMVLARRGGSLSSFKKFVGVIGVLAMLFPRAYVDYGSKIAYADAGNCEWKPWVYPATRLVGVYYVLVALNEFRKGTAEPPVEENSSDREFTSLLRRAAPLPISGR